MFDRQLREKAKSGKFFKIFLESDSQAGAFIIYYEEMQKFNKKGKEMVYKV